MTDYVVKLTGGYLIPPDKAERSPAGEAVDKRPREMT